MQAAVFEDQNVVVQQNNVKLMVLSKCECHTEKICLSVLVKDDLTSAVPHSSRKGSYQIRVFFTVTQEPPVGQGILIFEDSLSHLDRPHSVGLL